MFWERKFAQMLINCLRLRWFKQKSQKGQFVVSKVGAHSQAIDT